MTEPAHLRRFIRSTPRHSDLRLVGGVESGIDRSTPDGAAGAEEVATPDSASTTPTSPPSDKSARPGLGDAEHWRGRWHDLLARVRRRLEAGEESGE